MVSRYHDTMLVFIIRGLIAGLCLSSKRWLHFITCGWKPKRNDQKKKSYIWCLTLICAYGWEYDLTTAQILNTCTNTHNNVYLLRNLTKQTQNKFRTRQKACLGRVTDLTTITTLQTLIDMCKFQWSILQSLRYSKYRFRMTHKKNASSKNTRILNIVFIWWLQIKLHLFAVFYLNPDASSQADTLYHGVTAGRWSSTTYTNHYSNSTDETSYSA